MNRSQSGPFGREFLPNRNNEIRRSRRPGQTRRAFPFWAKADSRSGNKVRASHLFLMRCSNSFPDYEVPPTYTLSLMECMSNNLRGGGGYQQEAFPKTEHPLILGAGVPLKPWVGLSGAGPQCYGSIETSTVTGLRRPDKSEPLREPPV